MVEVYAESGQKAKLFPWLADFGRGAPDQRSAWTAGDNRSVVAPMQRPSAEQTPVGQQLPSRENRPAMD